MIRQATEADYAALHQIRPTITDDEIKGRLDKQSQGEVIYLVVAENNKLVSFVVLHWQGKKTHPEYPDMVDLYTMESERGKGYGTQLIAECERLVKEKGFTKIGLAVNPTLNAPAKRLYEKLGYTHDSKPPYIDGIYNGTEDWCIDLEKNLNS